MRIMSSRRICTENQVIGVLKPNTLSFLILFNEAVFANKKAQTSRQRGLVHEKGSTTNRKIRSVIILNENASIVGLLHWKPIKAPAKPLIWGGDERVKAPVPIQVEEHRRHAPPVGPKALIIPLVWIHAFRHMFYIFKFQVIRRGTACISANL
ncbi:MAG: hypothetical protein PUJ80_09155 [Verrucomicrobiota bacterium]|nr:hypothetical protein [Verrucomicrobiota bacterium]